MAMSLTLSIIIPHYNDVVRLGTCLEALVPQLPDGPEVEILVIDNASDVDLSPIKAAYPQCRWVVETRKGAAAARNRGMAESQGPFVIFLDCDCVPAPDWLATALKLCGPDELVGGRIDTFDETPPPRSGAEAFETVFAFHQKTYVEQKGFSVTANLLTSRHVCDATGPMVPGMAEDVDWCKAATARGFPLRYADELRVSHPTRQDWAALARKWRRTTNEMFRSHGTSPGKRLTWALRALAVAASALPHSGKILSAPELSRQEKWRGLGTLWHLRAQRAVWMLRQTISSGPV